MWNRSALVLLFALLATPPPLGARAQEEGEVVVPLEDAITLAGIFDTVNFDWGSELFEFTVSLLNDKNNGWFDDEVTVPINFEIANSACDAATALESFWSLLPLHGVVGARCSGASISIARLAALEGVAQCSMSSTSSQLSDKAKFPLFSRLVSPDDARGQVGALVATMSLFDWKHVTILNTDTPYATDVSTEFRRLWQGDVPYIGTIRLQEDGSIDEESLIKVLNEAPDDPTDKSRVVLLIAHGQHAFPILKIATERKFQPDSIFVGTQAWVGRLDEGDTSWLPEFPGYIGVTPFRNYEDDYYKEFLNRLQEYQAARGLSVWSDLPDYAAEHTVDAIIAMAMALSQTPVEQRRDGAVVTANLRNLDFNGISGRVRFTPEGDRQDPQFTIFNLQKRNEEFEWIGVGSTGTTVESAALGIDGIQNVCFAEVGCGLDTAPSSDYPVPKDPVELYVVIVIPLIGILLLFFVVKYFRGRRKKKALKARIDGELLDIDKAVEKARKRQEALILKRGAMEKKPSHWNDSTETLVGVTPDDEQYWAVADRLRKTMPDAHISSLWRVQNTSLWSYYSFHKDRLKMHEIDENERTVWHGTSALDPEVVYLDTHDGFMMQFSREGFWGRGIYFADQGKYSNCYAYKPQVASQHRPAGRSDEREMFLTKLLGGNEVLMKRDTDQERQECNKLTVPPVIPGTITKYNTVTGDTGGSKVWVVYENGRAYPEYLVRYYRGNRDPSRTPFESRQQAMNGAGDSKTSASDDTVDLEAGDSSNDSDGTWEFQDNSGWTPYGASHQSAIETLYKAYNANPQLSDQTIQIQGGEWKYEIDVVSMLQTNMEHPSRTQRAIRRL